MSTDTQRVDVLAVVETYSCAMADGSTEHGWTVKVEEDVLADFSDQESAQRFADAHNAAITRFVGAA